MNKKDFYTKMCDHITESNVDKIKKLYELAKSWGLNQSYMVPEFCELAARKNKLIVMTYLRSIDTETKEHVCRWNKDTICSHAIQNCHMNIVRWLIGSIHSETFERGHSCNEVFNRNDDLITFNDGDLIAALEYCSHTVNDSGIKMLKFILMYSFACDFTIDPIRLAIHSKNNVGTIVKILTNQPTSKAAKETASYWDIKQDHIKLVVEHIYNSKLLKHMIEIAREYNSPEEFSQLLSYKFLQNMLSLNSEKLASDSRLKKMRGEIENVLEEELSKIMVRFVLYG